MSKRKISITEAILKGLEKSAYISADLMTLLASKSYKGYRPGGKGPHSFYLTMNQLKRSGFVTKNAKGKKGSWKISRKGTARLHKIIMEKDPYLEATVEHKTKIISYDIPEEHRRSRSWLRGVLKLLDYEMVHRSVWVGKKKLPPDFFEVIKNEGIDQYIKIFEI
ncbi:MAG: hypothetical protein AAB682_00425 [Patescibacteria group bacterium]